MMVESSKATTLDSMIYSTHHQPITMGVPLYRGFTGSIKEHILPFYYYLPVVWGWRTYIAFLLLFARSVGMVALGGGNIGYRFMDILYNGLDYLHSEIPSVDGGIVVGPVGFCMYSVAAATLINPESTNRQPATTTKQRQ